MGSGGGEGKAFALSQCKIDLCEMYFVSSLETMQSHYDERVICYF